MRSHYTPCTWMRSRPKAALRTPFGIRASVFVGVGAVDLSQIGGITAAPDLGIVLKEEET